MKQETWTIGIPTAFVMICIRGWALMVLLGIGHGYADTIPAVGYWPAVGVAALVDLLGIKTKANSDG